MKDKQQFELDECMSNPNFMSYSSQTTPERRTSSLSAPLSPHHSSSSSDASPTFKTREDPIKGSKMKFGRKAHSFAYRIREHVRMGPKLSETVKGKLSLGARIIQKGGRENMFWQIFGTGEETTTTTTRSISSDDGGEKLLKASQCYLYTTAGPIAGILFISTARVAFCSERSITVSSPSGDHLVRTPYKVSIPIKKIKSANESENVNKPAQKYIQIVTEDNFEFWFMGFVRYEKAVMNLHKAISLCQVG